MGVGNKPKKGGIPQGIGKGLLAALILTLISAAIFAVLIQNERVSENFTSLWGIATLGVVSAISCFLAAKSVGEKYAVVSTLTGVAYAFILFGSGILFFEGELNGVAGNLAAVLVGSAVACAISVKKPVKKHKMKMRTR